MLKLQPEPTFKAVVNIRKPGGDIEPIEFEFRYRSADEWREWALASPGRSNLDTVMEMVVGWKNVDGDFTRENVDQLLKNYFMAGSEISSVYAAELSGAREKN